jgi:tRNA/rRNA methyltransferase
MITVILLKPETPENIGFICRAMANFDLSKLILIEPLCNPLDEQALRVSMHAKNILKKARVEEYSYLKKLRKDFDLIAGTTSVLGSDYNISRTPLTPEEFSKRIKNQKTVIVFGNEGKGLSNEDINYCDLIISIPTSKNYPSMNISHSAAVIFYELYKEIGLNKITSHIKKASKKEREILLEKMYNIIENADFSTKEKKEIQKKAWKSLFEKSIISKREAFTIMGLLNKIK